MLTLLQEIAPRAYRPKQRVHLTRSMVPQAIGNVTWAGIGPSDATDPGKVLGVP